MTRGAADAERLLRPHVDQRDVGRPVGRDRLRLDRRVAVVERANERARERRARLGPHDAARAGKPSGRLIVACSFACHVVKRSWPPVVLMSAFGVKSLPVPSAASRLQVFGEARQQRPAGALALRRRDLPRVVVAVAVRQVRRQVDRRERRRASGVRLYAVSGCRHRRRSRAGRRLRDRRPRPGRSTRSAAG